MRIFPQWKAPKSILSNYCFRIVSLILNLGISRISLPSSLDKLTIRLQCQTLMLSHPQASTSHCPTPPPPHKQLQHTFGWWWMPQFGQSRCQWRELDPFWNAEKLLIYVGNSDFWFWFLGPPLEAELRFRFRFWRFRSDFFFKLRCWKIEKSEFRFRNLEFRKK